MSREPGKLPGKTEYSGRRRTVTRKSGFKSAEGSTGGELVHFQVPATAITPQRPLKLTFEIPQVRGQLSGFGGWFTSDKQLMVEMNSDLDFRVTLDQYLNPDWGKFGSIWTAISDEVVTVDVIFKCESHVQMALYNPLCGLINHPHMDDAMLSKPALLKNMHQFAPEAIFLSKPGSWKVNREVGAVSVDLVQKSCNRCARFLPINIHNERAHLSFSNHCSARRPCSHSGFGKLRDLDSDEVIQLDYGYQLECRYCKKFEVNAAHNPKRTSGQMKEDGARRRSIEFLLTELSGGSAQMLFRHENSGAELADFIWEKFDRECFNCKQPIQTSRVMHLDHTRPLALLWPLDATATCLCGGCNSQKRDRSPSEYYPPEKLSQLSSITGIEIEELQKPGPNISALDLLVERQDWFFDEFLNKPELLKEREGKVTGELLVKALQKVINQSGREYPNLQQEFELRRS